MVTDVLSGATLEVSTPQVVFGFTPAGVLELDLGTSERVVLGFSGFTLSGSQTAVFEVSISGDGLSLQGGTPTSQVLEVSLDASNVTAGVTVMASDSAVSVGELSVRALDGVELAGGVQAVTLPIGVLQRVSLVFDPADVVEIERGRSAGFDVVITPSLVADRRTTVTLAISDQGFSFGRGTQHEIIVFDGEQVARDGDGGNDGGRGFDGIGVDGGGSDGPRALIWRRCRSTWSWSR